MAGGGGFPRLALETCLRSQNQEQILLQGGALHAPLSLFTERSNKLRSQLSVEREEKHRERGKGKGEKFQLSILFRAPSEEKG